MGRYEKGPMSFSGNLLPLYASLMKKYRMLIYRSAPCAFTRARLIVAVHPKCADWVSGSGAMCCRLSLGSGDTDACVPTWGTVDWIDSLNLTVTKPWTPWETEHLDGTTSQRAGYVTEYAHNFTFATVQGAGHMVPTYKPHFALTLINKWVAGEPLA